MYDHWCLNTNNQQSFQMMSKSVDALCYILDDFLSLPKSCSHTLALEAWVWTLGLPKNRSSPGMTSPNLWPSPGPWGQKSTQQRGRWCLSTWQSFVSSLRGGGTEKGRDGAFVVFLGGLPTPPRYRRYCIGCYLGSHEEWGLLFLFWQNSPKKAVLEEMTLICGQIMPTLNWFTVSVWMFFSNHLKQKELHLDETQARHVAGNWERFLILYSIFFGQFSPSRFFKRDVGGMGKYRLWWIGMG